MEIWEDELHFAVIYSRRRSLQIVVSRDGSVRVKAPRGMSPGTVRAKVQRRAAWIRKQQHYFKQLGPPPLPKQYISGETHYYLGRAYPLKIMHAVFNEVALLNGMLQISAQDLASTNIGHLLTAWYAKQAGIQFTAIYDRCWPAFSELGYTRPCMRIKPMRSRWGSMSSTGKMSINLELIKVPLACIEYVVMHELCHLRHLNHSKRFYVFLQQHMPDWRAREKLLKQTSHRIHAPRL